jgi:hypothetical protein
MTDRQRDTSEADEYEIKYMGGRRAIARSRKRFPWWFHITMNTPAAICGITAAVAAATGATPDVPALLAGLGIGAGLLCSALWLLFTHVRITVTMDHLHVQYGVLGPKIAIRDVVSIQAEQYDWKEFGGWGLKVSKRDGAQAYSVAGGADRGVRIEYRAEDGSIRKLFVSTEEPEEIVRAVRQVQRAASGVAEDQETEPAAEAAREAEPDDLSTPIEDKVAQMIEAEKDACDALRPQPVSSTVQPPEEEEEEVEVELEEAPFAARRGR